MAKLVVEKRVDYMDPDRMKSKSVCIGPTD